MSSSICKASVYKAYQDVINDVITNARDHFIEDGVDEAVLQELKQLWETKLTATKAVDESKDVDKMFNMNNKPKQDYVNPNFIKNLPPTVHQLQMHYQQQQQHHQQQQQQQHQEQQQHQSMMLSNKQIVGQVPPNNHMPQGRQGRGPPEWRRVPIQLTIPSAPGSSEGHRILSIDVPEVFLQGHHLKTILTGQAISTTMGLPLTTACAFLQEHVNAAFIEHQRTYFNSMSNGNGNRDQQLNQMHEHLLENRLRGIPQGDGPADYSYASLTNSTNPPFTNNNRLTGVPPGNDSDPVLNSSFPNELDDQNRLRGIPQGDGPADSSDDDDDKSDEGSEDIEEDKEEDEMEDDLTGDAEEEPLNSGDDVSDADGTEESFETDNVIVCQFDKITRSRNRWKFHLKDGIMNLNGEDFIFQKANGDAEW